MITLELQPADVENIRFAYNALTTLTTSYSALRRANDEPGLTAWLDEAQRALYGVDLPYMNALILSRYYVADFLTPNPTAARLDIEAELARLRETPEAFLRANIEHLNEVDGENALRSQFLAYPYESLECLIEELRLYWTRTLAHHAPRLDSLMDADVLYRAREMALRGVETMLPGLAGMVEYENRALRINKPHHPTRHRHHILNGDGLHLVPTLFKCDAIWWQVVEGQPALLIYGARGTGLWRPQAQPDPETALVLAIGEVKATILGALKEPAHTSELARRLHVTAGAISQQLGRLQQAGLVEPRRSGSRVYYQLTPRGEKLITLFME